VRIVGGCRPQCHPPITPMDADYQKMWRHGISVPPTTKQFPVSRREPALPRGPALPRPRSSPHASTSSRFHAASPPQTLHSPTHSIFTRSSIRGEVFFALRFLGSRSADIHALFYPGFRACSLSFLVASVAEFPYNTAVDSQTDGGRFLIVFFIDKRRGTALPIPARDMKSVERKYYAKHKQAP